MEWKYTYFWYYLQRPHRINPFNHNRYILFLNRCVVYNLNRYIIYNLSRYLNRCIVCYLVP